MRLAMQPLRQRLLELAAERPRFGYRRLHVMLVREGWQINRKRVYRVYRELGLAVRRKKRKRVAQANRLPRVVPIAAERPVVDGLHARHPGERPSVSDAQHRR